MDVDTGVSLGVDLTYPGKLPAPFAIPFGVSDLQEGGTYVVQAEVTNGSQAYAECRGRPGHHQREPDLGRPGRGLRGGRPGADSDAGAIRPAGTRG